MSSLAIALVVTGLITAGGLIGLCLARAVRRYQVLMGGCQVSVRDREVATGLRGLRNGLDVGPQLVEIHRLENEADRLQRAAIADLFVAGIDPMIVIRWKDIFDTLESAVDACETVANVLEGMTLKRANGSAG